MTDSPSESDHFELLRVQIRAAGARLEAELWSIAEQELAARFDE